MSAEHRIGQGELWPSIAGKTRSALASGALRPIETKQNLVAENGVKFQVRAVSSLALKDEHEPSSPGGTAELPAQTNPFLPYEDDLYVGDVTDTHFCLLNKFNVIDHHLLILSREFQHQEVLLGLKDFEALATCMREFDGLGFYNGGMVAGASQPHKHLQLVPLPLSSNGLAVPVQPLLDAAPAGAGIRNLPGLPFSHAFSRLDAAVFEDTRHGALVSYDLYYDMLEMLGLRGIKEEGGLWQRAPYNLLVTRQWMFLVPRTEELFESISVNALGFAGSLFVRNDAQLKTIREHGPMTVLQNVSVPRCS